MEWLDWFYNIDQDWVSVYHTSNQINLSIFWDLQKYQVNLHYLVGIWPVLNRYLDTRPVTSQIWINTYLWCRELRIHPKVLIRYHIHSEKSSKICWTNTIFRSFYVIFTYFCWKVCISVELVSNWILRFLCKQNFVLF